MVLRIIYHVAVAERITHKVSINLHPYQDDGADVEKGVLPLVSQGSQLRVGNTPLTIWPIWWTNVEEGNLPQVSQATQLKIGKGTLG